MKKSIFMLGLLALALNANSDQQADKSEQIAAAKTAIKQFAGELQTELKTAMQAGGPVAAIAVCNTQAMPITVRLSAEHGIQLSRVSQKNRNPANVPNDWQAAVLAGFDSQKAAGKDISTLSWSEIADTSEGQEFRFMKAIPTGDVCLKCHGTELAPEVSKVLSELYPEDHATGYNKGDIRGAFVVTRKIN